MSTDSKQDTWRAIYKELSAPIPIDAVQTKDFGDKAQGYNIAYLIDRLNTVLNKYGCTWEQEALSMGTLVAGNKLYYVRDKIETNYKGNATTKESIAVRTKITIKNAEGEILMTKESYGGCQLLNNSLGDTLKGAQTDSMKKVFSYFGLGNEAYKGSIHEQLRGFNYKLGKFTERSISVLESSYNLKKVTDKILVKYICSVVKKNYDGVYNLTEADMLLIEEDLCKLESKKPEKKAPKKLKKEKDEQKSKDGEDKVPAPKEEVDNPFPENDSPPF
jgi:hypothetical protein